MRPIYAAEAAGELATKTFGAIARRQILALGQGVAYP